MATYTKETALYDTGAIAGDIAEAGTTATSYIANIANDGIFVHQIDSGKDGATPTASTAYGVHISDDIDIIQGGVSVASYGSVARIGTENEANITIDESSISGVGATGKEFFVFENSLVRISTTKNHTVCNYRSMYYFPFQGTGWTSTLPDTPTSGTNVVMEVTIRNGTTVTKRGEISWQAGTSATKSVNLTDAYHSYGTLSATYNGSNTFSGIKLSSHYTADQTTEIRVIITYKIVDYGPAYKIGSGHTASGAYAYAEGYENTASGNYSHAEGYGTTASANYSHAEGKESTASDAQAHAEGLNTTASNVSSHSEGSNTVASGRFSHAQNRGTKAIADGQTTIGTFNELDDLTSTTHGSDDSDYGHYALIVGNGTADNARSNALTVNWNGNLAIAGQHESLFKITEVTKTISGGINANNYVAAANISMTAQTGYNAVGIVGHSSSNFRVQPTTNYVASNTAIFAGFSNLSATNVTSNVTIVFYVLWLKATSA